MYVMIDPYKCVSIHETAFVHSMSFYPKLFSQYRQGLSGPKAEDYTNARKTLLFFYPEELGIERFFQIEVLS